VTGRAGAGKIGAGLGEESRRMRRVVLVRHGHVEGIEPPRFRGRRELPLTELGLRQATAVARRIAAGPAPAAIWTSPVRRCVATGAAIAAATGAPMRLVEALNDMDYGDWTWLTYDAARAADPDLFERWYAAPSTVRFPGGESLQDLVLRAGDALRLAAAEPLAEDRPLVLVSHDSTIRAMTMLALDQPQTAYRRLLISPCSLTELQLDGAKTQVLGVNATEHLAGL
jgi:probable phosphoglycerate mutase